MRVLLIILLATSMAFAAGDGRARYNPGPDYKATATYIVAPSDAVNKNGYAVRITTGQREI